jgi:hypothetical protein
LNALVRLEIKDDSVDGVPLFSGVSSIVCCSDVSGC